MKKIKKISETITLSRDAAKDRLLQAGYEMLDDGAFAQVYKKPGASYVLKLFWSKDIAYQKYIDMIKQHPNPHFPKIIGKIVKVTPEYYAVRLEELKPFGWFSDVAEAFVDYTSCYIDNFGEEFPYDENMNVGEKFRYDKVMDARDWVSENPTLKEACDLIGQLLKDNPSMEADIRIPNIMKRGKTIVFIDPVQS